MNRALGKPSRWLLLLAVLALTAAACGGGGGEEEPAAEDTAAEEPADAGEATEPAATDEGTPEAQAQQGGTVVYGADQEPAILNPVLEEGNLFANGLITIAMLQGAYAVTPDFEYVPELIDGEAEITEDPFTVTYNIKDDVEWSDGTPVTARDFEFTWETIMNERWTITSREGYDQITEAEIVDDKTITFTFRQPYAPYRTLFGGATNPVLPAHALEGENFNRVWNNEIPVVNGPFMFDSWDKGQQLTLVRNENYSGNSPNQGPDVAAIDRVVIRFIEDSTTQVQQLRGGEIDMFYPQPQLELVEQVDAIDGVTSDVSAGTVWEHLDFNQEVAPLDQQFVRQAIGMGIDRQAITEQLMTPIYPESVPLNNVIYMTNQAQYEDHWSEDIPYDPEGAIALLEDNGCTRGQGDVFECDGQRLEFGFVTTAGNELRELTFEVIQAQLAEIGVAMNADFGEAAVVFGERLINMDYDTFMFAWVGSPDPSGGNTIWYCDGALNYMNYCNEEVEQTIRRTDRILDPEERAAAYNEGDELISQDVPLIPLYQKPTFFAWQERIQGPQDNPTQWGPFWNIGTWTITG